MSKQQTNRILTTVPTGGENAQGALAENANSASNRAAVEPLLLDLTEAAACLRLSERSLKRLDAEGGLPRGIVVRIGRRRLFARRPLEQWVASGCPLRKR